jgi:hypothetical protein
VASPSSAAEDLLQHALRGDAAPWPAGEAEHTLLSTAEVHGIGGLLHARGLPAGWPEGVRESFRRIATQQAMWELRHQQLLRAALGRLHAAGIEPVLLKGTPLAYSLYPDPALRRRGDTDLIVAPPQRDPAIAILQELGWTREPGVTGDYISYQCTLSRRTPDGVHAIDLHWRINNAQLLAPLFTYADLRSRARPLPSLAPNAWAPDDVDSLLIACMHRATHRHNPYHVDGHAHHDPDRLIWLCDIDLLARRLPPAEWRDLLDRARAKQLRRVTLEGLRRAQSVFGTPLDEPTVQALGAPGHEPPADYLEAGRGRQFWMDLRALPAGARLHYLKELAFPPAGYMRERFGASRGGLPWLYLRRAAQGMLKRWRTHP